MAKISLRSYIHEIEGMMDKGQIEEVSAHCRHVLQSFPKLLAAYRLLGKALLENRQYTDAADIFQRVLSSTPDDFVSQVGMSIIREDEGNLDAAIWHMERAFEVQPYNVAIQDELRRLYGRRDGIEPPKVRLTRGALARMYAKGNLYQQAIAELRAGLMEDPSRVDLQIVLARMYFQSRQRAEAVDTCNALIKKFPYCLEANRILSIILPETGRKEDTQVYRQRVLALDPYLVHADPEAVTSDAVPENIVMIERLDYQKSETGTESPSQPAWAASLGVNINEFAPKKEEVVPDWLASIQQKVADDAHKTDAQPFLELPAESSSSSSPFVFGESTDEGAGKPATPLEGSTQQPAFSDQPDKVEQSAETGQPEDTGQSGVPGLPGWLSGVEEGAQSSESQSPNELIPDWMKTAGWVAGSGDAKGESLGNSLEASEPAAQPGDEIAKADVPDWLKAMAPEGALEEKPGPSEKKGGEIGLPASSDAQNPVEAEIPDWLNEIGISEPSGESIPEPQPPSPASSGIEMPDWLQGIGEEKGPAAETGAPIEEKATIWEEEKPVEIPVSAPLKESVPGVNLEDQDAALAWLESLAAKQGVSEEELITRPEERQETPPSWLQEPVPGEPKEEAPVQIEAEVPAETVVPPKAIETPVPLEPAVPEVQAEVPGETEGAELPDWLKEIPAEPAAGVPGEAVEKPEKAVEPAELPDWLLVMEAGTTVVSEPAAEEKGPIPEEPAQPVEVPPAIPVETSPETVTVWEEQGVSEIPVSAPLQESVPGVNLNDQDAAMAWLESLAAKQGAAEEELTTRPEERLETPPSWVGEISEEGLPSKPEVEAEAPTEVKPEPALGVQVPTEAIAELKTEITAAPEEAVAAEAAEEPTRPVSGVELPDWLQEMAVEESPAAAQPKAAPEKPTEEVGLPDWLQEISLEEAAPIQAEPEIQAEPAASIEQAAEPVVPPPVEAEVQLPAILSDEEAGMAWLESLAAKQGVPEEELTIRPEERPETPPAWVHEQPAEEQPAVPEQPTGFEQPPTETTPQAGPVVEAGEPAAVEQFASTEQPVTEEKFEEQPVVEEQPAPGEAPALKVEETQPAEEAAIPAWLEEMASAEETPTALEEAAVQEEKPAAAGEIPIPQPWETEPPLPAWLEHAGEEEAIELPEIASAPPININTASLVELENLPGIGFILAQAIINHREKHGPFNRVDDLAEVDGFNPGIVAEIHDKVTAIQPSAPGTAAAPEVKEIESIEGYDAELMKARNAMVAGDVDSTLVHYGLLINKEQLLVEVIRDLHEALYRYPVDANIWTALGDAYMHHNQLQEALDAYAKAEELIR